MRAGVLYIVATPIGNLEDISPRALRVLAEVDRIAVEDTRHSRRLLSHYGINTPLLACHEHNEDEVTTLLVDRLLTGESVALVSDAGTPLISDPGYRLVHTARARGIFVSPVPGPSALTAALSVSGLPTDRFVFEGFLPARHQARVTRLESLAHEVRTLVFYESSHRIADVLGDMAGVFGPDRPAVVAREMTKMFEQVQSDQLAGLVEWLRSDPHHLKGEFVVLVAGASIVRGALDEDDRRILEMLLQELTVKKAAALAADITGKRKKDFYDAAVRMKDAPSTEPPD